MNTVRAVARGILGLCGCLATGAALAGPRQGATAPAELGQVVVEASRPPVLGLGTHAPVRILTATTLRNLGVDNLGQALQLMPIFGSANGLGTGRTDKFTNGGEQSADLFDLTNSRVVILVNGQRWTEGFQGDTDLSTFPVALIERIEVYPARGGVRYGDAAIAGVVNIVTVPSFNGVMASAGTGSAQGSGHWDGRHTWVSLALGRRGISSGLTALLSWSDQNSVSAADRSLTAGPLAGTGTSRLSPITPYGQFEFVPTSGPYATSSLCPVQANGERRCDLTASPGVAGGYVPRTAGDVFNTLPYNYLVMPLEQWGIYVSGFHRLSHDLQASASIFVGRRTSSQLGAPSTLTLGASGLPISVSANQSYNPFGVALDATGPDANLIALSESMNALGPVVFHDTSDTYRATVSLQGSFARHAGSAWTWRMAYLWSSSRVDDRNQGRINLQNLALALGAPSACAAVPACTPLDLFAGPGSITAAMSAFIGLPENNRIANTLQTLSATVTQPELLKLPAGPLALGAGYQYEARHGDFQPDPAAARGIDSAVPLLSVPSYVGGYSGDAVWAETVVPLIGGRRALTLGGGVRLYDFSHTGSGHVGEATLSFDATRDVSLQAGWAQGFRTPDLRELGESMPGAAATVSDPCSSYAAAGISAVVAAACAAAGVPASYVQSNPQTQSLKIGNPALQAETSENSWLNAKWRPRSAPGLSLDLAYYRIDISNAISRLSAQQTLLECYQLGNALDCSGIYRAPDGQLTVVSTQAFNGQRIRTDWLTGGFQYDRPTSRGAFAVRSDLAWTRRYTVITPSADGTSVQNLAGVELGSGSPSGIPRWSGTVSLDWRYERWNAGWMVRVIGPMTEACTDRYAGTSLSYAALGLCSEPDLRNSALSRNKLGTTSFHDLYFGYRFSRRLRVSAGIENLFNQDPPTSVLQPLHYDPSIYPAPGRTLYASVNFRTG
jgi:iron complex outermembrane receptor protein